MPQDMKIWTISNQDTLTEIGKSKLEEEDRLEAWLEKDISMLSDDLLVIGRQVITAYKKKIDLLCIDSNGDIVIVELKRQKTPRDTTAQTIDYASWVKYLSHENIIDIANDYLKKKKGCTLDVAFTEAFDTWSLPESLNEQHRMLIVASEIDSSTERIIKYLTDEPYGVPATEMGSNLYMLHAFITFASISLYFSRTASFSAIFSLKRRRNRYTAP